MNLKTFKATIFDSRLQVEFLSLITVIFFFQPSTEKWCVKSIITAMKYKEYRPLLISEKNVCVLKL